jgi:hypothetical protein
MKNQVILLPIVAGGDAGKKEIVTQNDIKTC